MHVPAPIADQVRGTGAILMNGIGVIAFVFAIWQFGWKGVAVALAALAALLIVQLWVESARLTRIAEGLEREKQAMAGRIATLEHNERRVPELEAELGAREDEIRELRSSAERPKFGEQRLLESVEAHVKVFDLTQKHRRISHDHPATWPVIRASLSNDGRAVVIAAVVGDEAERLADEYVALTDENGEVQAQGEVLIAGDREIRAAFSLDTVPLEFAEALEEAQSFSPAGYFLKLAGLTLFPGVSDEQIDGLQSAALTFSDELRDVLVQQPHQGVLHDPSQFSGGDTE